MTPGPNDLSAHRGVCTARTRSKTRCARSCHVFVFLILELGGARWMKKNTICIPPSYSPHLEHTKKGKKKSLSPRQHREPQELLKPQPRTGAAGDAQSHGATLHLPAAPLRHTRHRKRAGNPSARINSSVLAPATCQRSGCTHSRDTGTPAPQKP